MGKKRGYPFGIGIVLLVIVVLAGVLTAVAAVKQNASAESGRADMIAIDGLKAFGPLERPVVRFYHDKHTDALAKKNKDCAVCHETAKGVLSQKFKRLTDNDKDSVMMIYHDQCIGCHKEVGEENESNPPVTCGACHKEDAPQESVWQPIGLDKSLHYRHMKANENKCEKCHHEYNDQAKALFYAKGKEGACVYCHQEETRDNRISTRLASHQSCIACHRQMIAKNKNAGPIQCGGCHDPKQQALLEKIAPTPRMERNQPDVVLVKTGLQQNNPQPITGRMMMVPFDHKAHEGYNNSCKQCHHAGLQSCAACHTIQGADEGKQVKLAQAMHQNNAASSCIGCHYRQQAQPECAGCHSRISKASSLTNEAACKTCHMESRASNPFPAEGSEESKTAAADLLASRPPAASMVPLDQIPETVTIKTLANEYEAAVMPHRKIVLKLAEGIKDSRLAGHFHAESATLCQGCHHKSPASAMPPQCNSCHGRSSEALNLNRPGLMAAFHQQCIQCHDEMGLEKPVSRDCTACHAKRK